MSDDSCQPSADTFTNVEPCANYRPTQPRFRARKSVEHTIRDGIASMLRSVARRDDFDLPNLAHLAAMRAALEDAIQVAVDNLRDQGHPWQAIADELGITRQSAWDRYHHDT
jgi:hypothetical protein